MKPVLALIGGCVPLAALTVASFVDLGTAEPPFAEALAPIDGRLEAAAAEDAAKTARAEAPLAKELNAADLFGIEALPAVQNAPAESPLRPLAEAWPLWTGARQLVTRVVDAEQLANSNDLDQLKEAAEQFAAIQKKYEKAPPRGAERLIETLQRRQAAVRVKIAKKEREIEANQILAQARTAFRPQQYETCLRLCDQLLTTYADALDNSILAKVRVLRERAEFWSDAERLAGLLVAANEPPQRMTRLREFLDKYPDRRERTESELKILEDRERELRRLEAAAAETEQGQAAARSMEQLRRDPPADLADRLARAREIAGQYPSAAVRAQLRREARAWLAQSLPEKQLAEPPQFREMETTRGELIRGFIKEVKGPDGSATGYKRYSTQEQMLRPVAEVGTYRPEDLRRRPAETVPRTCVTRYHEARDRVLAAPAERDAWQTLAELCNAIDGELRAYRAKPGAGRDELSFAAEERFARRAVEGSLWEQIAQLFADP
jgi:hypothetical protein